MRELLSELPLREELRRQLTPAKRAVLRRKVRQALANAPRVVIGGVPGVLVPEDSLLAFAVLHYAAPERLP